MSKQKFKYSSIMETPEDSLMSILDGLRYLENEANAAGFLRLSQTIKNIREKPSAWLENRKERKNLNNINLDN